ncbi:MAG: GntR family transcriptional regulator, partial [Desulfovibrionaceae bacterium]|nr:GntR family transcriptional regulator [Desulfovibrionaceae bacterium]
LRRRLYDFPRRQYSYEWESMNLYTHQRFIDSVKLGNREAAVSIFRIEHWSYEVHKKYFKLYYDFDQKK